MKVLSVGQRVAIVAGNYKASTGTIVAIHPRKYHAYTVKIDGIVWPKNTTAEYGCHESELQPLVNENTELQKGTRVLTKNNTLGVVVGTALDAFNFSMLYAVHYDEGTTECFEASELTILKIETITIITNNELTEGSRVRISGYDELGTIRAIMDSVHGKLALVQRDDNTYTRMFLSELEALPTGKYSTDEIVLIKTEDSRLGSVFIPAIVRYYDSDHDAYEVNALLPAHRHAATRDDIAWWTVNESEIVQSLGKATTERPTLGDHMRKLAGFDA